LYKGGVNLLKNKNLNSINLKFIIMKKKLESELVSIAHRILKLKGKEDVIKMHAEVSILFEKLSVLKFLNETAEDDIPTIGNDSSFLDILDNVFNSKKAVTPKIETNDYIDFNNTENEDSIMVPGIETIKKMVEHMPNEVEHIDEVLKDITPLKESPENDFDDLLANFKSIPVFEPVFKTQNSISNEKKSLNDKLKNGGLNVGLNDKIAFIKHLFDGSNEDYERVISQLKAFDSYEEAKQFILDIVKLDYNNWIGKEDVEDRFLQIIESKYN